MKNKLSLFVIALSCIAFVITACSKKKELYQEYSDSTENVLLYLTNATNGINSIGAFDTSTSTLFKTIKRTFAVGYGGVGLPATDIQVDVTINQKFFDSLNVERLIFGKKPYLPIPVSALNIDKQSVTISKGKVYSELITLTFDITKLDLKNEYFIAFTSKTNSAYKINPALASILYEVRK